jgi:hypothetical protein
MTGAGVLTKFLRHVLQLHEMVARIPGATWRPGLPESMNAPNVEAPNGNTPTPHEAFVQAVSYKYDLDTTVPNVQVLHANGFSSPQSASVPDSCVIRSPQGVSSPHVSRSQVSSPHQVSSPRVEQVRDHRGLPFRVGSVMSAANSALEGGSVGSETVQQEEDEGQSVQDSFPTENGREPETEWVEQDEPGVYITLVALQGGGKDLKRVRFRYQSGSLLPQISNEGLNGWLCGLVGITSYDLHETE